MTEPPAESPDSTPPRSGPFDHELSTDPGRPHPYESLYRNSGQPARPTPRHWEPSLRPPDEADRSGDTYGWLYREEDADLPEAGPDVPWSAPDAAPAGAPAAGPTARSGPASPAAASSAAGGDDEPDSRIAAPAAGPSRAVAGLEVAVRRGPNPVAAALVLLLALLAVVGIWWVVGEQEGRGGLTGVGTSTATGRQPSGDEDEPYAGQVLPLSPTRATVDCQAPPATDAAGTPVNYEPALMLDGDLSTAWRCNGTGVGTTVVFTFPGGTTLAQVGLVNGYTKVDPATGDARYEEYRQITGVTWTFTDGTSVKQSLDDDDENAQVLRIPPLQTARVTATITATSEPGKKAKTRDAIFISGVAFAGPKD